MCVQVPHDVLAPCGSVCSRRLRLPKSGGWRQGHPDRTANQHHPECVWGANNLYLRVVNYALWCLYYGCMHALWRLNIQALFLPHLWFKILKPEAWCMCHSIFMERTHMCLSRAAPWHFVCPQTQRHAHFGLDLIEIFFISAMLLPCCSCCTSLYKHKCISAQACTYSASHAGSYCPVATAACNYNTILQCRCGSGKLRALLVLLSKGQCQLGYKKLPIQ